MTISRRTCLVAIAGAVAGSPVLAASSESDERWADLAGDIFKGRPLADAQGLIAVEMPYRAEDAALVPVTLRTALPCGDSRRLQTITLVIDENPAPVAATFATAADAGLSMISTRVRVNSYTQVHAVAELSDGSLHVAKTFVKASGGCSAPAVRNVEEARTHLGEMRFRQFAAATDGPASSPREAQIMIRHPNNSGLQMDQVTHLFIPVFFVRALKVWQGERQLFAMEGGISISEDPNIRFAYAPNGAETFRAEAIDTNGNVFKGEWPVDTSAM